jgi:ABC-2 type transport system ATP-binding protein
MIEVSHLTKKYGNHIAVNDLSFQVEKGQVYGLLGKNGAGKSTTMNILTGFLGATEGKVTIDGHDIYEEAEEAKKCIGYLPEIPPLYDSMTVEEQLSFAAELKKIPKNERQKQIEEVMELTGVGEYRQRLIANLSKGFRQRVGLAQAVLGYPPILILDEPTVGLDPKQMIEIRELIRSLARNHTIILSSHILTEVSAVCDYIMIIADGKLVASDTTENMEKMLDHGESKLELCVKGNEEEIGKALQDIDGVEQIEIEKAGAQGLCNLCLKIGNQRKEETDIREEVFFCLSEKKLPIYAMSMAKNSLEDVFLALTEDTGSEETTDEKADTGRKAKRKKAEKAAIEEATEEAGTAVVGETTEEAEQAIAGETTGEAERAIAGETIEKAADAENEGGAKDAGDL